MRSLSDNRIPITLACIQWFITTVLQVDRLFFTYDYENKYLIITKLLYAVSLIAVWCFIFHVYRQVNYRNESYIRGLSIFKFYICMIAILLLILWPGTWALDDLRVLCNICEYNSWMPWQHIITGMYQDVLLQILPFPGGIILLQNIIIALCVAFFVTKMEQIFGIRRLKRSLIDRLVKVCPFLMPPVIMYQFSGYRMGLYIYLELVLIVMISDTIKESKKEWTMPYLFFFCIVCIVVSSWRTESFLYTIFASVYIFFADEKLVSKTKKLICVLTVLIGVGGVNRLQNCELGNSNYKIISLARPCAELVRNADIISDKAILESVDKVVSIDTILNNPCMNGETLYWNGNLVRYNYSDLDYKDFKRAFIQLALKYPKVVIHERWNLFIVGSGITGESYTNVNEAATMFDNGNSNSAAIAALEKGWIANNPVLKNTRRNFINILGMKKGDSIYAVWLQRIIWNSLIPMIILLCALIGYLLDRKWHWAGVCTAVLIRVPIVVLTQPAGWFMYVLTFYFLGYIYLVYYILIRWSNRSGGKKKR